MNIRSAKAKGRRCAQAVVDLLRKYWPEGQQDDIWVTPASVPGEDIKLSPNAQLKYPCTIECKNVESLNIWKALEQAESHANKKLLTTAVDKHEGIVYFSSLVPLLFFKRNKSKLYVALDAETFIKFFAQNVK